MRIPSKAAGVVLAALSLVTVACQTKKGGPVIGSCDKQKDPNDYSSSHRCRDFHDKRLLKDVCTGKGEKVQETPCDRTGVIGACKTSDTESWMYNDQTLYPDPQTLSTLCEPDPVLLADGTVFTPKGAAAVNADKAKEGMTKYGAKVKTNLATIATLKKLPAPTGKVNLEGLKGGALVVHAEDIADPEHPKTIPYRLATTDRLAMCRRFAESRAQPTDDPDALYYCAQPVLLVVSVTSVKKPAPTGTTQSGNTKTTLYSKGRITGDVLVFRTDSGKYLGSFGFDAENQQIPVFATTEKIEAELYQQFAETLTSRAQKEIPGLVSSFSLAK